MLSSARLCSCLLDPHDFFPDRISYWVLGLGSWVLKCGLQYAHNGCQKLSAYKQSRAMQVLISNRTFIGGSVKRETSCNALLSSWSDMMLHMCPPVYLILLFYFPPSQKTVSFRLHLFPMPTFFALGLRSLFLRVQRMDFGEILPIERPQSCHLDPPTVNAYNILNHDCKCKIEMDSALPQCVLRIPRLLGEK